MKKLFTVPFLLLAFATNVQASTVTFEDNAVDTIQANSIVSGELTFTPVSGNFYTYTSHVGAINGTNALLAGEGHYQYFPGTTFDFGGGFSFKETDNTAFDLNSLDSGLAWSQSKTGSVVFTGHQSDGGILTQLLSLNKAYTHFVFGWTNLLSVEVSGNSDFGYVAYDNINVTSAASGVNAVPVPAAVWLFGSALTGIVGLGRRKKAQD
jgi:hypothetical protein